jgi:hypothetical protein
MKRLFLLATISLLLLTGNALATFESGSTGADGAFSPTANTVLQLPPDGVFNYTTVNIPSGVTVTFQKNANNTPVYMLATGNVTISGTVRVDGVAGGTGIGGIGGPGGFNGGAGGAPYSPGGKGFGPGGGNGSTTSSYCAGGGGYGATGAAYTGCGSGGSTYGYNNLIPLIGGSGGGGAGSSGSSIASGGGGGGGAILIASSGTITINGLVSAYGGNYAGFSAGGSGGAIRIVATTVSGTGSLNASGGTGGYYNAGGLGRIRIEAGTRNFTFTTNPSYTYSMPGSTSISNSPILTITSIGGVSVPANPVASYSQPDVFLPNTTTNPVAIAVSAANIPVGTTVTVSVIPQYGSATSATAALSGTQASSTATANVTIPTQNFLSIITAQATFVLQTAMYWEGDKIEKVRVAAAMGKEPDTVYITTSGKEIKAKELMMAGILE